MSTWTRRGDFYEAETCEMGTGDPDGEGPMVALRIQPFELDKPVFVLLDRDQVQAFQESLTNLARRIWPVEGR